MIRPVKTYTKISTKFGAKPYPYSTFGVHTGVDYAGPEGRMVFAPVSGVVTMSYISKVIGNCIEIKEDGTGRLHRLMHLKMRYVIKGQKVKLGQHIADSGGAKGKTWSGSASTGPHLHWDVRKANTAWNHSVSDYINPELLLGKTVRKRHYEKVRRGTWFVRPSMSFKSIPVGIVFGGQVYDTVVHNGWRQITYKGKTRYVGRGAWM